MGVAAAFIFVNSAAYLLGKKGGVRDLTDAMPICGIAILIGGLAESYFGVVHVPRIVIIRLSGIVLTLAGVKLLISCPSYWKE